MKEKEKRKPRAYKIADKPYNKAKKLADGELAPMIEWAVTEFAKGGVDIAIFDRHDKSVKTFRVI